MLDLLTTVRWEGSDDSDAAKSVNQFSEAIRLIPNHPSLHPPTQRGLAPIFSGPGVPRLMGTSVAVQGVLLAHVNGIGTGNPTAVFQQNRERAEIQQKASMQN